MNFNNKKFFYWIVGKTNIYLSFNLKITLCSFDDDLCVIILLGCFIKRKIYVQIIIS